MQIQTKANQNRYSPVLVLILASISISLLTRIALLIYTGSGFEYSLKNIAGVLFIGLLYDLVTASFLMIPLVLHIWFQNDRIYEKRFRPFVILIYLAIIAVLLFTQLIPADFNEDLRKFVIYYFVIRFLIYFLLCFLSRDTRNKWRMAVLYLDLFIFFFVLLLNAMSEWFFWQEFSVRYNFIAVDYLIYTTEVIGNIRESYPLNWILSGIALIAILGVYLVRKPVNASVRTSMSFVRRTVVALALLIFPFIFYFAAREGWHHFSKNEYANELAGNGMFQFNYAFWNNELDFFKFYKTLPEREAFSIIRQELSAPNAKFTSNDLFNIEREITPTGPERKLNVVLISIESFSADFMKHFGNPKNITPFLDSLCTQSLFFTNLYASGTRTVRGLEALALSIPPVPGQSIVKRPDNGNLFSAGNVFRSKGYTTQYIYGGYSYFDNMDAFFSRNGYEVIDRSALKPAEIHYQNIWGVADEDLFTLALKTLDNNHAKGKPFFSQIMTVSNHRPFTYPDGRIDIPPSTQSREGAVKYTDYAIGKFIREASARPWFDSTVFVIVADHCAGSAGSVQLPVTGYHIPLMIYAPKVVQPAMIAQLTAQIDITPTVFGLLKFNYRSKFFGQDVLTYPNTTGRAFISTYQGLGYLENNKLIIQSPLKQVKEYEPDFRTGTSTERPVDSILAKKAISYYECASWLTKHRGYNFR